MALFHHDVEAWSPHLIWAGYATVIDDFQRLLGCLRDLSRSELLTLDATVRGLLSAPPPPAPSEPPSDMPGAGPTPSAEPRPEGIGAIEVAFAGDPECPHCQSKRVGKWGSANRLKRYRCKGCGVSFNCLTGTPLAQLHKRDLWAGQAQVLVDGISVRKGAARLDVNPKTAFRWRHRFLSAPKTMKALKVQGTVEADETFFPALVQGLPQAVSQTPQAWRRRRQAGPVGRPSARADRAGSNG